MNKQKWTKLNAKLKCLLT